MKTSSGRPKENTDFRKTVAEGYFSEVTLMSISPGDNIGREVHEGADEVIFIVEAMCEGKCSRVKLDVTHVGLNPPYRIGGPRSIWLALKPPPF